MYNWLSWKTLFVCMAVGLVGSAAFASADEQEITNPLYQPHLLHDVIASKYGKQLVLGADVFSEERFQQALQSLRDDQSIMTLSLTGYKLSDNCIGKLSEFLSTNDSVQTLALSGDGWSEADFSSLGASLTGNHSLTLLKFEFAKSSNKKRVSNFYNNLQSNKGLQLAIWGAQSAKLLGSIANDNSYAALHVGLHHKQALTTVANDKLYRDWIIKSSAAGNPIGQFEAAEIAIKDNQTTEALKLLNLSGEHGYGPALLKLAEYYRGAWGAAEPNKVLSIDYCKRAAELLPAAKYRLARIYEHSDDEQLINQSANLYYQAATRGHIPSQEALIGNLFEKALQILPTNKTAANAAVQNAWQHINYMSQITPKIKRFINNYEQEQAKQMSQTTSETTSQKQFAPANNPGDNGSKAGVIFETMEKPSAESPELIEFKTEVDRQLATIRNSNSVPADYKALRSAVDTTEPAQQKALHEYDAFTYALLAESYEQHRQALEQAKQQTNVVATFFKAVGRKMKAAPSAINKAVMGTNVQQHYDKEKQKSIEDLKQKQQFIIDNLETAIASEVLFADRKRDRLTELESEFKTRQAQLANRLVNIGQSDDVYNQQGTQNCAELSTQMQNLVTAYELAQTRLQNSAITNVMEDFNDLKRSRFYDFLRYHLSNLLVIHEGVSLGMVDRKVTILEKEMRTASMVTGVFLPPVGFGIIVGSVVLGKAKDLKFKHAAAKLAKLYDYRGVEGINDFSSKLASEVLYRFQTQVPYLTIESLDVFAQLVAQRIIDFCLSSKKAALDNISDIVMRATIRKPSLFSNSPKLTTELNDIWSAPDLLRYSGIQNVDGKLFAPSNGSDLAKFLNRWHRTYNCYRCIEEATELEYLAGKHLPYKEAPEDYKTVYKSSQSNNTIKYPRSLLKKAYVGAKRSAQMIATVQALLSIDY